MPWRVVLITLIVGLVCAQAQGPAPAKVLERYKQMLEKNPVEGTALDRLWKDASQAGQTAQLLQEYELLSSGGSGGSGIESQSPKVSKPQSPSAGGAQFSGAMVLGHLRRRAGLEKEAAEAFERAAQLDLQSVLPWQALARLRMDQNQAREAALCWEKALSLGGESAEVLMQLGAAWLSAGELEKASEAWERIVRVDPGNLELRHRLAENYVQNRLGDRAIVHLEWIVKKAGPAERAQALQQLARIHQVAGREEQAMGALEEALSVTAPGNWLRGELQGQLIRLYQRYHRIEELEARWKKSLEENPRDAGAYLQLIELYARLGDLEQQKVWLERLVELAPKEYRLRLARLYAQMDDIDKAAASYDLLLKAQPRQVDLVFERAQLDVRKHDEASARRRIAELVASAPADETLRQRSLEFYEQHQFVDLVEARLKADAQAHTEEAVFALARFYQGRKREAESRAILWGWAGNKGPAYLRLAQVFRERTDLALEAAREAVRLSPEVREGYLLLGDLELGKGNRELAQAAYEKALSLSRTEAEVLEADQKLFERFVATEAGEVASYIQSLMKSLAESAEPTVSGWLRVARWQLWNRQADQALQTAGKALALDPKSRQALEFLVRLASAESQPLEAIGYIQRLMEIDPAGRLGYRRRIAQLELQAGHAERAVEIFRELVLPGDVEALTELAQAQQHAELWNEALLTWQKIYSLTPVAGRREVGAALVSIYQRLSMGKEATELQLREIDDLTDEKERLARFGELLASATRAGRLRWLREEFETRRRVRPDDYFLGMALGRVLKAMGDPAAAFDVLSDACLSAEDPLAAIPELVREAEELNKLEAAVRLQAQLVRLAPQTRPDALEKLAELQERNFEIGKAWQTWERLLGRFPREAGVLERAAEFQLHWGTPQRARELLVRMEKLDPSNAQTQWLLAELAVEAGAIVEAQRALEKVLELTVSEKGPVRYPGLKMGDPKYLKNAYGQRLRRTAGVQDLKDFWSAPEFGVQSELRLKAIRNLAQLLVARGDAAALKAWEETWCKELERAPTECLWALFYADASAPLLDSVLLARSEAERHPMQAFVLYALETGEFVRLAGWFQDGKRTPADRDFAVMALAEYLQRQPGPVDLHETLFGAEFCPRLWQGALAFASAERYPQAIALGRRVFDSLKARRSSYALVLARWYLTVGDVAGARAVLGACMRETGDSFDAPVYEAMRSYYWILPADERAAFVEKGLKEMAGPALHRVIGSTLLHALAGHGQAARDSLRRLLDLRPMAPDGESPDSRYWTFILSAGLQLQQWHFEGLSMDLWGEAVADSAALRLQATSQSAILATVAEIRTRLTAMRLVRGSEDPGLVRKYQRASGVLDLIPLAEALEGIGAASRGIELYWQLWESEPGNPHALRNLANACRSAGDTETLEEVYGRSVRGGYYRANPWAHRDLVLQWSAMLEARGAFIQAEACLSELLEPGDAGLWLQLAQVQERAGHSALESYRKVLAKDPANADARLGLANHLENQQRRDEAIALLESPPSLDLPLIRLLLKADRWPQAVRVLDRLPLQSPAFALVADDLIARNHREVARSVLFNALNRNPDPSTAVALQAKLLTTYSAEDDQTMLSRQRLQLRRMVNQNSPTTPPELALEVRVKSSPGNFAQRLQWARALFVQKQTEEAKAQLDALLPICALNESLLGELAKAYLDFGFASKPLFERALAADPLAQDYSVYLAYAALRAGEGDSAGAKALLRRAFANPANRDWPALIAVLTRCGKLEEFEGIVRFHPQRLLQLRRAVLAEYQKRGDSARAAALLAAHPELRG